MLSYEQVQSMVNAMQGSHNRVEAAICMYARMVDKENLWMVLYALKVWSQWQMLIRLTLTRQLTVFALNM